MSPPTRPPAKIEHPHALTTDAALAALASDACGLSDAEAARRLDEVGPNRLPEPPRDGALKRFFKHFNDVLIYVLLGAATITAALGHLIDTGTLFSGGKQRAWDRHLVHDELAALGIAGVLQHLHGRVAARIVGVVGIIGPGQ